ncbi:ligand-binding protein SH3 [Spirochaetia bacterium]|nr:ligand-binding protein SH3 [Spirochaetia bacterium]
MSKIAVFCWTALLSFMPISELRGAIPFAISNGIPWYITYPFAVALNALVAPVCWIFLSTFHKLFLHWRWYSGFFDRFVERARVKIHPLVEKWGWIGIALFVGIPLPITGAWTGTLGSWVLGMNKGKTMLAIVLGVIISGVIVTAVWLLGIRALDIFIKHG